MKCSGSAGGIAISAYLFHHQISKPPENFFANGNSGGFGLQPLNALGYR
jgi:hypothetical protein